MSIDRISISNGALDRTLQSNGTEDVRPASPSKQSRSSAADDAISLSGNARDAERLTTMLDSSRTGRMDSVRDAIAGGTYSVSGSDIASRLIALNTR